MSTTICELNSTFSAKLAQTILVNENRLEKNFWVIASSIVTLAIIIGMYYTFCDHERIVTFKENFETALDNMARYDARQRLKKKKTVSKKDSEKDTPKPSVFTQEIEV